MAGTRTLLAIQRNIERRALPLQSKAQVGLGVVHPLLHDMRDIYGDIGVHVGLNNTRLDGRVSRTRRGGGGVPRQGFLSPRLGHYQYLQRAGLRNFINKESQHRLVQYCI